MQVRFWGTRGSIPSPGPQTATYGGNTSCVEIVASDGTEIILDCGTGARALGQHLMQRGGSPLRIHLFVGHTHWDHIQGFPFFVPAFVPGTELDVYAPRGFQQSLEETLAGQMQHAYFPLRLHELPSRLRFTQLEEGFFRLGDLLIETQQLNHTAPTIAYRISADGATVVYSTDHEPFWKPGGLNFRHPGDQRHVEFLEGADLVIHDSQYSEAEYPARLGWGHSTVEYATDVAVAAHARRLALFHHDPTRTDEAIREFEQGAQGRAERYGSATEIFAAAEGLVLELRGSGATRQIAHLPATDDRPIAGSSVLLVGTDDQTSMAIGQEMWEDRLMLVHRPNMQAALAQAPEFMPDLVILDAPERPADEPIQQLRTRLQRPTLPVLVLTDDEEEGIDLIDGALSSVDFLAKPFSPPMLRSRVRSWLARTAQGTEGAAPAISSRSDARVTPTPGALVAPEALRNALRSVSLFAQVNSEDLDSLYTNATEAFFDGGEVMIRQDDRSAAIFVILSGSAQVIEIPDDPSAPDIVLGRVGPGEVVGELAALTGLPRSATVIAVDPVHCLAVPSEAFMHLMRRSPALATSVARGLARKIYDTDRQVASFGPNPLTGLLSRRAFQDYYALFAAQARRRGTGVLLLLIDVVHLRDVNEAAGYGAGDQVLQTIALTLQESTRQSDLVARWGGDEFVVLPSDAEPAGAETIVARIQRKLANLCVARVLPEGLRCAYGVAVAEVPPDTADELVRAADADMQWRKEQGSG